MRARGRPARLVRARLAELAPARRKPNNHEGEWDLTELSGKVALVTGASKGIGRATALSLAREGADIVAAARSGDLLGALRGEVEALGRRCLAQPCDVTQREQCERLVRQAAEALGGIDILVNNAGVGYSGAVIDSDPDEAERMLKVNVLGVYLMTRAVLPAMIQRGGGDIVNLGSVAGVKYSPNFAVYSATKFAVRALSEALRNEVQAHNIRVTLVHPGMTRTAFYDSFAEKGAPIPVDKGALLEPDDVADAIRYAVSQPSGVALNEVTIRPNWQER
jgi:clavulanate-9-aldehyde reductase